MHFHKMIIKHLLGLQKIGRGIAVHLTRRRSSSVMTSASKIETTEIKNDGYVTQKKPQSKLIAAAFESLKIQEDEGSDRQTPVSRPEGIVNLDERILNAKTVNSLLAVTANSSQVTRKHALKIVSILSQWTSINRIKLADFESDQRFIKLCRMLGRANPKNGATPAVNNKISKSIDDLNTVLGIAGDDEAAKLVASISLSQMVKVMSTLAQKKRRSTPLLRALAFNISGSSEQLDLKQCADLLYAMATLNFPDSVLVAKICADMQLGLPKNEDKSAVVGSILTSFGLLKYRDLDVLESLVSWVLTHVDKCRPQDVSALFLTMATLNFTSQSVDQIKSKLVASLQRGDFPSHHEYLSYIWALTLLGFASNSHIENVLSDKFIDDLSSERNKLTTTTKMKLLNINWHAKLVSADYKGPFIPEQSPVNSVTIAYNKSKQTLLNGMLDALKSLVPSSPYVRSMVDSKMGFLIDAQCTFDTKRNPLPFDKEHKNAIKVAFMVVDFHDLCHGADRSISGIMNLYFNLLRKSGFKVLTIPYNEFSTSDKVLKRVQYLEGKLKNIIASK